MMQKRKRSKKWIYWVVILVLAVAAGVVVYLVWRNKNENNNEQETVVVEEKKGEEKKVEVVENDDNERETEKEKVTAYEGGNPNKVESLTGAVTYAGVSPDGRELVIRVNIDQYLGGGSCELNLVQGGVSYKDTANITSSASTATCEGFNVPADGLSGDYEIVIYMSSGEKVGTIKGKVSI